MKSCLPVRVVAVALAGVALTALGSTTPAAQAPHRYTIEDLSIPGAGASFADAIDDEGTVWATRKSVQAAASARFGSTTPAAVTSTP